MVRPGSLDAKVDALPTELSRLYKMFMFNKYVLWTCVKYTVYEKTIIEVVKNMLLSTVKRYMRENGIFNEKDISKANYLLPA